MTPSEIHAECLALEALITSRGFLRPEVAFFVNFFGGKPYSLQVQLRTKESYETMISDYTDCQTEADIPLLFAGARSWIARQKDPATIRKEQFIASLGRVIDEARSLNLEVEFMNPLVESMKRLSENVLEYRPAAE